MNLETVTTACFDELQKIAKTRAVKEWQQAAGAGNQAYADQIAQSSGQLGLKPRYLENVSEGGMEAAVDKMMGRAGALGQAQDPALSQRLQQFKKNKTQFARASTQHATSAPGSVPQQAAEKTLGRLGGPTGMLSGTRPQASTRPAPNESGYIARKVYKPDSPIATGEGMGQLLQTKQQMTNSARSLSPDAKSMVPAMYGHQQIQGPEGQLRHVSEHEYVPGLKSMKHYSTNAGDIEQVANMQRHVAGPMAAKGMAMRDIPRLHMEGGAVSVGGNASNLGVSPQGPKVIDFLPEGMTSSTSGGMMGVLQKGRDDIAYSQLGSGRTDTAYGSHNLNQLRRDVFRPTANYSPPALQHAASEASTAARPATNLAAAATKTVPSRAASIATKATKMAPATKAMKPLGRLAQAATRML